MRALLFRLPRTRPALFLLLTATLGLAIGLPTAAFSVLYSVVYQPLPYSDPARLVMLWTQWDRFGSGNLFAGAANVRDWKEQSKAFEDIALVRHIANYSITGHGEPERLIGARTSGNFFRLLGMRPLLGRTYTDEQTTANRAETNVVVLSERLWRRRFGGDPGVIHRELTLNGFQYTVIGVMPDSLRFPSSEFELWAPLVHRKEEFELRLGLDYLAVGRLRPGVSMASAQLELDAISSRLAAAYPVNKGQRGAIAPMFGEETRTVRPALWLVFGAAGLLMLLGCANVANLMLARASTRKREIAVRTALGASPGRTMRDLSLELAPVLLCAAGLSVMVAAWGAEATAALLPPGTPRADEIRIHPAVLGFSFAAVCVVALLVALVPSIATWRLHSPGAWRGATADARTLRVRDAIVAAQLALAMVLLTGAALLGRTLERLAAVDPGFRAASALSLHLAIARGKYKSDENIARLSERFAKSVAAVPGVAAAGLVNRLPMGGVAQLGAMQFDTGAGDASLESMSVDWRSATPGYFDAAGIPLLRGRGFTDADTPESGAVGIIDQQIADRIWPGQDPIGRRMRIGPQQPWLEIVGVVGHVRNDSLTTDPRPQVYWPLNQRTQDRLAMVVRVKGDPASFTRAITAAIRAVDPDQALHDVRPMTQVVARTYSTQTLASTLLMVFAAGSLLLASTGLYGVAAFFAGQRAREFGIRAALGAAPAAIRRLVLARALWTAAAGLGSGYAAARACTGLVGSLLFGVTGHDPAPPLLAATVLLLVVMAASWLPAMRAAHADPVQSLREE